MSVLQMQILVPCWMLCNVCHLLPCNAVRKHGTACQPVSVCPSVHPSVALVYCVHMAIDIVKLFLGR